MNTSCSVDGCDKPGYCREWCRMHYMRWYRHGDPLTVGKCGPPFGRYGPASPNWKGTAATYNLSHKRVRVANGSAAAHFCAHCGGLAAQWAYDHADPDERTTEQGWRYSTDPTHYMPLCIPCHRQFDRRKASP